MFAVPGPEPARYETVDLPENDFPLLRVVAHPAPDEKGRPAIEDAWVPGDGRPPRGEERLVARWSEAQDAKARETWLTLDLGARHQPFDAVELDVDGRALLPRGPRRGPARAADPGGRGVVGGDRPRRPLPAGARRAARASACASRPAAASGPCASACATWTTVRCRSAGSPLQVPVERLLFEAERPGALPAHLRLVRPDGAVLRPRAHGGGPRRVGRSGTAGAPGPAPAPGGRRRRTTAPGRSATRRSCGPASSRSSWRWGR